MKFRMVDRILDWQSRQHILGVKTVSFEEYQLAAALGGPARLPETLLLESLFQLGNWLIILSSDFERMGLVLRAQRVEFLGPVSPGQSVRMDVQVRRYREDGILFDGQASVGGRAVGLGVGCLAVPVSLAEYCVADDLRVLYSQIHRPQCGAERRQSGLAGGERVPAEN